MEKVIVKSIHISIVKDYMKEKSILFFQDSLCLNIITGKKGYITQSCGFLGLSERKEYRDLIKAEVWVNNAFVSNGFEIRVYGKNHMKEMEELAKDLTQKFSGTRAIVWLCEEEEKIHTTFSDMIDAMKY